MKRNKVLLLLAALVCCFGQSFARPVNQTTARQAAQAFYAMYGNPGNMELTYAITGNSPGAVDTLLYVFNTGSGFVMVAAEDAVSPILGYSTTSRFEHTTRSIPPALAKWLEGYRQQISYARAHNLAATPEITAHWERLLAGAPGSGPKLKATAVTPLLETTWDQSPYYNELCPWDDDYDEQTVTGCVATAMAQVMKYWNYPATGSGFHSYNHPNYGTLSANFGATTYDWAAMPNNVTGPNAAVATLMYQVGVSVDMGYNVGSEGGSGAYVIESASPVTHCSEYALKNYFGYKPSMQGIRRSYYTDLQWMNLIKNEINESRPIIYAGFGGGGGHCFVADGYDNNDFIHFNWGWGGYFDGYFESHALNPGGTGTGGGTGGFNSGHQAIIGVEPIDTATSTGDLQLYNAVTPSANIIQYGSDFTISTNIHNASAANFNGDYCAAVFDINNTFIGYVEIKTDQSLAAGDAYAEDLVFSAEGLTGMVPGDYKVGVFYRPEGGNWVMVGNSGGYTNMITMTVVNPNEIELYSPIQVAGGTELTQGDPVSVSVNLANNGSSTFEGIYAVRLFHFDGSLAQEIDTIIESEGLLEDAFYPDPLVFNAASLTVAPGTYLLAVEYLPADSTEWELAGSSVYPNPIYVTVVEPELTPDMYEVNNTVAEAYNLELDFISDQAIRKTTGSNCHIGTDYDYYKIELPAGYDYTISPRLQDAYSSDDGETYTLDALFSYSTDGGATWGGAYDDVLPANILTAGPATLLFKVSPYFTGDAGTYTLDIQVDRALLSVGKNNQPGGAITVYPNPASTYLIIDGSSLQGALLSASLYNMQGQQVLSQNLNGQARTRLATDQLPAGVYYLTVTTDRGTYNRKISVVK